MRRQNSWTDPTIIGEHRGTLWFHRPELNSISGNVVIRPFPSHASKFPPRRFTTWLASPGFIRTRPLHPIERNWPYASHPLTIGEAIDCCGVSLPVPLFGSRSFNERPLCARSGPSPKIAWDGHGRLTGPASRFGKLPLGRTAQCFGMRIYHATPLHSGDMVGVR
jgi:hypothetical protein